MYINLKQLKENPGQEIKIILNSGAEHEKKEYNGKSWNVFNYKVLMDNQEYSLEATDAIHRKIQLYKTGDCLNLSYEQFTNNEGQLRSYWKLEKFEKPEYESVKSTGNGTFEQYAEKAKQAAKDYKQESTVADKIKEENTMRMNGARFGMIFNNVVRIFIANEMNMTTSDIVQCFKRVESWVDACEDPSSTPLVTKVNEPVANDVLDQPVTIEEDELPF